MIDLAKKVAKSAKMPFIPRIRVEQGLMAKSQLLIDAGVLDPEPARVFAESCPAVVTCSEDCTAKVWNAATGELEITLAGHKKAINTAAVTVDVKWAVTASDDETAKIWILDGVAQ